MKSLGLGVVQERRLSHPGASVRAPLRMPVLHMESEMTPRMNASRKNLPLKAFVAGRRLLLPALCGVVIATGAAAQERGNPPGEWRYWGGDAWSTRYSPLDEINADNFEELEVAWIWRVDNFGPTVDYSVSATPIYADGRLFTVAGRSRQVVAIDPLRGRRSGHSGNLTPLGGSAPIGRTAARAWPLPRWTAGGLSTR